MKLSEFRNNLENWLSQVLRIDIWDLDAPTIKPTVINDVGYPPNSVVRYPLEGAKINHGDGTVTFTMRYDISYRFRKHLTYHQLPIPELEVAWLSLTDSFLTRISDLSDGQASGDANVSIPLTISVSEANTDWICTVNLSARVKLYYTPETIPESLQPLVSEVPLNINSLTVSGYVDANLKYTFDTP